MYFAWLRMSLEDVYAEFTLVDMCHLYPLVGYDPTLAAWNVYQIRDRWCRTERGVNRCGGCHLRDGGLFNNNQVRLFHSPTETSIEHITTSGLNSRGARAVRAVGGRGGRARAGGARAGRPQQILEPPRRHGERAHRLRAHSGTAACVFSMCF